MADLFQQVEASAPPAIRPRARAQEITERIVDTSLLVYDLEQQRVHILNPTAALIWHLCDGSRPTDQIAALVAEAFPEQQSVAERDVAELVQAFVVERLLRV